MKKRIIPNLIWFAIFGAVLATVRHPDVPGFSSLAYLAIWLLITLGLVAGFSLLALVSNAKDKGHKNHEMARATVLKQAKEFSSRGPVYHAWNWMQAGAMTAMLGFAGMTFSGFAYAMAMFFCWVATEVIKDFAKEHGDPPALDKVCTCPSCRDI